MGNDGVDPPAGLRSRVYRVADYAPGTTAGVWLLNWIVQRVFRIDADCPFAKHYTSRVMHPRGLRIEDDCPMVRRSFAVSGGCYINAADGLFIGRGTIWAPNVAIVSQDHGRTDLNDSPATAGIRIGRHCWIGFGAIIMPGVELGDHTIVGANAVVTKSFGSGHQIVAGVPARVVKRLDQSCSQYA